MFKKTMYGLEKNGEYKVWEISVWESFRGEDHPDYCMCPCCELDDHCDDEEDEIDGHDD